MRIRFSLVIGGAVWVVALLNLSGAEPLPQTPKKPVTDEYEGVKVEDNYQWLEQDDDSTVKAWSDAQSRQTRDYLDKLPDRAAIEKQLTAWYAKTSPTYSGIVSRPGILFARKFQPPKQQQMLVMLASAEDLKSEKIVLDPNKLDPSGKTAIDWFVPSRDGKYVAMSISQGGSEDGTLYVYETATGKPLKDSIAHVQYPTAGGSAAWNADGTGIYYTRFPRKGQRPDADLNFYQQVYFHKIGTADSKDIYSIGKDFPRIAEIKLETSHDGNYILATVANGDGGDFAHYLLGRDGNWKQLTQFSDRIKAARIGRDGALYLLSRAEAPRGKVLRAPLDKPELANATVIVPPSDAVIQFMEPTADAIYVGDLLGGPSQIRRFGLNGEGETVVPIPNISAVTEMESLEDNSLLFRDVSYTEPATWFHLTGNAPSTRTALVDSSPVSFADIEVSREMATSKDGTKVPLNIIRKKGAKLDGNNPMVLLGYRGGSGCKPHGVVVLTRLWITRGGVVVVGETHGGRGSTVVEEPVGGVTIKQKVIVLML